MYLLGWSAQLGANQYFCPLDLAYRSLLYVHIAAGFLSLTVFFVPAFARKGSRLHVRAGWIYVWGMAVVVTTALLLSLLMVGRGNWEFGLFFCFLSLITAGPLYYGTVIVRYRGRPVPPRVRRLRLVFLAGAALLTPVLLLAGGGWLGARPNPLLLVFGLLGLTTWPEWWAIWRNHQPTSDNWLFEHVRGLLVSSIAAFTAFFAFGGARLFAGLFVGPWSVVPWIIPTVVGTAVIHHYRRKFA